MSIWSKDSSDQDLGSKSGGTPSRPAVSPASLQTPAGQGSPRLAPESTRSASSIGRTVVIKGEIRATEDLYVDGQVEGRLDLGEHRLTIGPNGQVRASIRAREVDVQGSVNGNVEASDRIIIRKDAKLVGDLKMSGVVIEDGAYFKGSIDISQGAPQKAAGPPIVDKSAAPPPPA
jgi:cytoskeletal protein CcmA (bactofilin family)